MGVPCCRTNQFSRSSLPAAVCMWNLLPSGVFRGILNSFSELVPTEELA